MTDERPNWVLPTNDKPRAHLALIFVDVLEQAGRLNAYDAARIRARARAVIYGHTLKEQVFDALLRL